MPVLDHVFVMCDVDAPEAIALARLGLEEMTSNTHPGQGTACRRFSLADQYLELLWVCDEAEVRSERTRPTRLWERWAGRRSGACPFGFVFRADPAEASRAPFRTWSYSPSYLSPGCSIEVGVDAPMRGPAFFFLPFVTSNRCRSPIQLGADTLHAVTEVRLGMPGPWPASDAIGWAEGRGLLSFERADAFQLTLGLDHSLTGHRASFRPHLPLALEW